MKASLQRIGNSLGVVIPKPLLRQLGIERAVEIQLVDDHLEVRKLASHPREGWKSVMSALPQSAFDMTDEDREWLAMPEPESEA
ncbi:MAG TPA: AbrB/MazE/SpoVT family DNA-binding domain-containing protein [Candidatus Tyrphobacter sp.]